MGSCACNSMGRGSPDGPPRVKASRKSARSVLCLASERNVRASLDNVVDVCGQRKDVRHLRQQFGSLRKSTDGFTHHRTNFKLTLPSYTTELECQPTVNFVVTLFEIRGRRCHDVHAIARSMLQIAGDNPIERSIPRFSRPVFPRHQHSTVAPNSLRLVHS